MVVSLRDAVLWQDEIVAGGNGVGNRVQVGYCASQIAENDSPRGHRLVQGAPPSMNEPVRSVLHKLTGANCAQTKLTITLIAM
jgi:hypothetical protein